MSAAARVLERLPRARPFRAGQWRAPCPSHQSRGLTLGVAERDGRVLLHCFAGCETDAVLAALGLELRDLFDQPVNFGAPAARSPWHPRDVLDLAMRETATVAVVASDLIERRARRSPLHWKPERNSGPNPNSEFPIPNSPTGCLPPDLLASCSTIGVQS